MVDSLNPASALVLAPLPLRAKAFYATIICDRIEPLAAFGHFIEG